MAKKHRILIIDDSKETVLGLKAYLGRKYHVLIAYCGRDGIQKYDQNESRIDLILTDLILPDARGGYLISWFKKKTPDKPVIAMTGWEGDPAEEFETDSIADWVLKKPFELEELDLALEKLLKTAS